MPVPYTESENGHVSKSKGKHLMMKNIFLEKKQPSLKYCLDKDLFSWRPAMIAPLKKRMVVSKYDTRLDFTMIDDDL